MSLTGEPTTRANPGLMSSGIARRADVRLRFDPFVHSSSDGTAPRSTRQESRGGVLPEYASWMGKRPRRRGQAPWPDGCQRDNPPRDAKLPCLYGIEFTTDGPSWQFDTIEARQTFVAEALHRARAGGAATSVIHTLRVVLS